MEGIILTSPALRVKPAHPIVGVIVSSHSLFLYAMQLICSIWMYIIELSVHVLLEPPLNRIHLIIIEHIMAIAGTMEMLKDLICKY